MPQGLKNSPATYQRLMNKVLKGMDAYVFVFQDDILIYSKNFEDHILHIQAVLKRLQKANLTISSSKCHFGREKVKFLGHIISSSGIEKNPAKVDAIRKLPIPRTRRQLRGFLGAVGWFRHFINNMADIAQPLYNVLKGQRRYVWTSEANEAFHKLKDILAEDIILHHPDVNKPYILRTDASSRGWGCCLLQLDDNGNEQAISFGSKVFTQAQLHWSALEKEAFAIISSIDLNAEYLDGATFSIETDNQALTYLNSMKNTNSKLMRCSMKLQEWSPSITHIKGRDNVVSDYLSRAFPDIADEEPNLIINAAITLSCDIDKTTLKKKQQEDQNCKTIMLSNPDQYCVASDIIYKKLQNGKLVPLIPTYLRENVLRSLHDSSISGHFGFDKTYHKLRQCAFFPGMRKYTKDYITTCDQCQRNKYDNKKTAGKMGVKPIHQPWHTIYLDLMGPYTSSTPNRYAYVLVAVDAFTKFVELHPLREATAAQLCSVMEKEILCRYSTPKIIVTDNATNFRSELLSTLCKRWGIRHSFSSSYNPQTNQAERVNRVVKTMIRTYLDNKPHTRWPDQLPAFQLAINTSTNDSTGFAPIKLLFNIDPVLPIDNFIGPDDDSEEEIDINDPNFSSRFSEFQQNFQEAKKNLEAAQRTQKLNYDKDHREDSFQLGDHVTIRNTTLSNKEKKITASLCPLYNNVGIISKVISPNTFEVTFPNGSTKGPLHIQFLRRYHPRTQTPDPVPSNSQPNNPPDPDSQPSTPTSTRTLRPRQPVDYRALNRGR